MTIQKEQSGTALTVSVAGRLDTMTAPELEAALDEAALKGVETLTFNLAELEYISSAGLRALLALHKIMSKRGGMTVTNVGETVMEVFEVTGFVDALNIA